MYFRAGGPHDGRITMGKGISLRVGKWRVLSSSRKPEECRRHDDHTSADDSPASLTRHEAAVDQADALPEPHDSRKRDQDCENDQYCFQHGLISIMESWKVRFVPGGLDRVEPCQRGTYCLQCAW